MTVHVVPSATRLSAFRIARLLEQLAPRAPDLGGLLVQDFFLVQGEAEPAALRRLLGDGPAALPDGPGRLFVVPRLGTVSPWSSKATDIARVCGLEGVQRIELARVVVPQGEAMIPAEAWGALHDPMMESVLTDAAQLAHVFDTREPRPLRRVPVLSGGRDALVAANREWGLALSDEEIDYLVRHALASKQDPSDAELMMFAQVNSEHCRHKIFNAEFSVDGQEQPLSLFQMIKESHKASPQGVLSAYKDNASVIEGFQAMRWFPQADHVWRAHDERVEILMKVETHNHPTGISPHPGAATGAGGEIRDEAATGRGGKPKAGLCGFTVANLRIPDLVQPWEAELPRPPRMASALSIMLEAPIGAAAYNNEFGRPNLAGYFRTYEAIAPDGRNRGYHKPIMIAGGYGNIRTQHVEKLPVIEGAQLIVLGGPAMLIGLGGGAASSMATGASSAELDFASVQRANPELERRCQEVIDACWAMGDANPILSVHDVGAGGISNALPELVHADDRGGHFRLRDVLSADPSLSPMEIWCNESQERYVLAVRPEGARQLQALCARERCPMAVVGTATAERQLIVEDRDGSYPVDMPMPVLLGKPPRMKRNSARAAAAAVPFAMPEDFEQAARRVLQHPSVASKQFLITIGDRTVGGLSVRDQMVGPWQVPVADCAVTATGFEAITGEAMSMGERPVLALLDAPASGRMAVGEAITNIAAARVAALSDVRLSANWMAACGQGDEDARLFDTVRTVGAELCPKLGIAIPVGKDSLSMKSVWSDATGTMQTQIAPLSLIVSAFAPVTDVRASLTPQLRVDAGETALVLIDLGEGRNRLGGSILVQVHSQLGETPPDLDDPAKLRAAFDLVQRWNGEGRVLAYHDRSDGGLLATLCEMAFAGHCGVRAGGLDAPGWFAEELGMVLQVRAGDVDALVTQAASLGLRAIDVGAPSEDDRIVIYSATDKLLLDEARSTLFKTWTETSYRIARLRDNPVCVDEEFEASGRFSDPGLGASLGFDPAPRAVPTVARRPRVAVLREQGVNGQAEMAYAFHAAGFESVDVHMSDILGGRVKLADFQGLVACGGFSYGDVLGAGQGWARTILFNPRGRDEFQTFLADTSKFALGVCNGCQMFAALQELVPGAKHWPMFRRNRSEQFEARWSMVEVLESKSILLAGMAGSRMPIAVAHGEGRAEFRVDAHLASMQANGQIAMRYIDNAGEVATRYPANPNGSPSGVTAICNEDGRVTILMPHPERTIHGVTGSWWPQATRGAKTPWFRIFENARSWVG
ncbi:MAG: purL [Panacagrimonas sp.]|jgi:phosphoribosylformylglycinamidine synthase|nr:phosphoribosylformylglycinamidine synthase [Panacagrimonas sp.]MCC2656007.1 purL [Panacagrimonas sp.]